MQDVSFHGKASRPVITGKIMTPFLLTFLSQSLRVSFFFLLPLTQPPNLANISFMNGF